MRAARFVVRECCREKLGEVWVYGVGVCEIGSKDLGVLR